MYAYRLTARLNVAGTYTLAYKQAFAFCCIGNSVEQQNLIHTSLHAHGCKYRKQQAIGLQSDQLPITTLYSSCSLYIANQCNRQCATCVVHVIRGEWNMKVWRQYTCLFFFYFMFVCQVKLYQYHLTMTLYLSHFARSSLNIGNRSCILNWACKNLCKENNTSKVGKAKIWVYMFYISEPKQTPQNERKNISFNP